MDRLPISYAFKKEKYSIDLKVVFFFSDKNPHLCTPPYGKRIISFNYIYLKELLLQGLS